MGRKLMRVGFGCEICWRELKMKLRGVYIVVKRKEKKFGGKGSMVILGSTRDECNTGCSRFSGRMRESVVSLNQMIERHVAAVAFAFGMGF